MKNVVVVIGILGHLNSYSGNLKYTATQNSRNVFRSAAFVYCSFTVIGVSDCIGVHQIESE